MGTEQFISMGLSFHMTHRLNHYPYNLTSRLRQKNIYVRKYKATNSLR